MRIKKVNKSRKSYNCSVIKPMLKRPMVKRRQNEIEEENFFLKNGCSGIGIIYFYVEMWTYFLQAKIIRTIYTGSCTLGSQNKC